MFTGIIEEMGRVLQTVSEGRNIHFTISSSIAKELTVDQSVAHNGVCLTVVKVDENKGHHVVTAIDETLNKSNLGSLKTGESVNLERCLKLSDRLDGHMVQGHVDTMATCTRADQKDGSWEYTFRLNHPQNGLLVEKGSIAVNGISLTAINVSDHEFSVAIIPFTEEHTTFHQTEVDSTVNIEFDILGKYIQAQVKSV